QPATAEAAPERPGGSASEGRRRGARRGEGGSAGVPVRAVDRHTGQGAAGLSLGRGQVGAAVCGEAGGAAELAGGRRRVEARPGAGGDGDAGAAGPADTSAE